MTLDRRKVLIYLRPDISASERFADAKIEAHHRGDRGDMSRTALLAGLALGEVDSRLPSMLAARVFPAKWYQLSIIPLPRSRYSSSTVSIASHHRRCVTIPQNKASTSTKTSA